MAKSPEINTENPLSFRLVKVDRNRWMLAFFVTLAVCVGLIVYNAKLQKSASEYQLVTVKVYQNGTWDIDFAERSFEAQQPQFFIQTVNKLLIDFVKGRYTVNPETVQSDYSRALNFMSRDMGNEFKNIDNAIDKAMEIFKCGSSCITTAVRYRFLNHIEKIDTGDADKVYRTEIYIELIPNDDTPPMPRVVEVTWHILSLNQIEQKYPNVNTDREMQEYLMLNPIGLEIIDYEIFDDTSVTTKTSKDN